MLHIILCQNTQQREDYEGVIIQSVAKAFCNNVQSHFYQKEPRRWLTKKERILLLLKAFWKSNRGDYLFLQGQGLIWFLLLSLFFRHRILIYWNFIFYTSDHTFSNSVQKWLVKKANKKGEVYLTVNAIELQTIYSNLFQLEEKHFPLVNDPMQISPTLKTKSERKKEDAFVFFGGRAKRDIVCFEKIVRNMPDVKFVAVLSPKDVSNELSTLKNLQLFMDIPTDDFYDILSKSSVCCIPLKSKEPCGLFVMQHAILMNIPIVSSETYSMRTIIPDDSYGFLCEIGDYEAMISRIRLLLNDKDLSTRLSNKAKQRIEEQFSEEYVSNQMYDALKKIQLD